MYSSAYVWAKVLSHMEERLGAVTISAWFDDAEIVELNEDHLILYSPSDFRREIISRRCNDYVRDALKEIFNSDDVRYGGSGVTNTGAELLSRSNPDLKSGVAAEKICPWAIRFRLPPLGVTVLRLKKKRFEDD